MNRNALHAIKDIASRAEVSNRRKSQAQWQCLDLRGLGGRPKTSITSRLSKILTYKLDQSALGRHVLRLTNSGQHFGPQSRAPDLWQRKDLVYLSLAEHSTHSIAQAPPLSHDLADAFGKVGVLEERIGYVFRDKMICVQALKFTKEPWQMHFDGVNYPVAHNNRLALVGDRALELALCQAWYQRGGTAQQYTVISQDIASRSALNVKGRILNIQKSILLPPGTAPVNFMVSETLEAVFGAIYVDSGYDYNTLISVLEALGMLDHKELQPKTTTKNTSTGVTTSPAQAAAPPAQAAAPPFQVAAPPVQVAAPPAQAETSAPRYKVQDFRLAKAVDYQMRKYEIDTAGYWRGVAAIDKLTCAWPIKIRLLRRTVRRMKPLRRERKNQQAKKEGTETIKPKNSDAELSTTLPESVQQPSARNESQTVSDSKSSFKELPHGIRRESASIVESSSAGGTKQSGTWALSAQEPVVKSPGEEIKKSKVKAVQAKKLSTGHDITRPGRVEVEGGNTPGPANKTNAGCCSTADLAATHDSPSASTSGDAAVPLPETGTIASALPRNERSLNSVALPDEGPPRQEEIIGSGSLAIVVSKEASLVEEQDFPANPTCLEALGSEAQIELKGSTASTSQLSTLNIDSFDMYGGVYLKNRSPKIPRFQVAVICAFFSAHFPLYKRPDLLARYEHSAFRADVTDGLPTTAPWFGMFLKWRNPTQWPDLSDTDTWYPTPEQEKGAPKSTESEEEPAHLLSNTDSGHLASVPDGQMRFFLTTHPRLPTYTRFVENQIAFLLSNVGKPWNISCDYQDSARLSSWASTKYYTQTLKVVNVMVESDDVRTIQIQQIKLGLKARAWRDGLACILGKAPDPGLLDALVVQMVAMEVYLTTYRKPQHSHESGEEKNSTYELSDKEKDWLYEVFEDTKKLVRESVEQIGQRVHYELEDGLMKRALKRRLERLETLQMLTGLYKTHQELPKNLVPLAAYPFGNFRATQQLLTARRLQPTSVPEQHAGQEQTSGPSEQRDTTENAKASAKFETQQDDVEGQAADAVPTDPVHESNSYGPTHPGEATEEHGARPPASANEAKRTQIRMPTRPTASSVTSGFRDLRYTPPPPPPPPPSAHRSSPSARRHRRPLRDIVSPSFQQLRDDYMSAQDALRDRPPWQVEEPTQYERRRGPDTRRVIPGVHRTRYKGRAMKSLSNFVWAGNEPK